MADSKIRVCRDDDMKVKIGDICTLKSGTSLKEDVLNESNGIPYIKVSDMNLVGNEKYIVRANSYADESINEKMLFPKGTVLFPKRGGAIGTNKKRIASKTVCADLNTMGVIPSDKISPLYLYYFFHNIDFATLYNGSSVPQINNTDIAPMEINLISLEEQDNIVTLLEKIDDIVRKRKKELSALDNLIKARFVEMFGDPISNPKGYKKEAIEKHIDLLSGYPFKSEQYVDKGINICGGLIIMPQKIKWEECVHWESTDGYEDYLLNENDIVMALDRPWIAEGFKIAKIDANHLPALLIQRTARIRALDLNQDYLYYCFINGGFDRHSNVTGSLVPHISAKDIRSFKVMLPPIELQNQFADFVRAVDKSKVKVQKALNETQKLFDSLMQQYFG